MYNGHQRASTKDSLVTYSISHQTGHVFQDSVSVCLPMIFSSLCIVFCSSVFIPRCISLPLYKPQATFSVSKSTYMYKPRLICIPKVTVHTYIHICTGVHVCTYSVHVQWLLKLYTLIDGDKLTSLVKKDMHPLHPCPMPSALILLGNTYMYM